MLKLNAGSNTKIEPKVNPIMLENVGIQCLFSKNESSFIQKIEPIAKPIASGSKNIKSKLEIAVIY